MPGFKNVRAWADSASDGGKHWISTFRKAPASSASNAGNWFDYSISPGNPTANFYSGTPLQATLLSGSDGIIVPTMDANSSLFLHRITVMSAASSSASVTNANQHLMLSDYLLYYPNIDMDSTDPQPTTQPVSLPRYTDGVGVQMALVAVFPTTGGGQFVVSYTDSDNVSQVTPTLFCPSNQPAGALVNATTGVGGTVPFIPLAAGVKGVKSIENITFSVANGGLAALILFRPLETIWLREECRTPGESFGDVAEKEAVRTRAGAVKIESGAYLNFMGRGANGTLGSSVLVGSLEVVWN